MTIYAGQKVQFIHQGQGENFGVPAKNAALLTYGEIYEVREVETHSWHTKIWLVDFEVPFNSVWFEQVSQEDEKSFEAQQDLWCYLSRPEFDLNHFVQTLLAEGLARNADSLTRVREDADYWRAMERHVRHEQRRAKSIEHYRQEAINAQNQAL